MTCELGVPMNFFPYYIPELSFQGKEWLVAEMCTQKFRTCVTRICNKSEFQMNFKKMKKRKKRETKHFKKRRAQRY